MNISIEASWKEPLEKLFRSDYFNEITQKVKSAYASESVWPKGKDIFAAFNHCPFDKLKVVILGQDPYPTPGHAHGLCFSVPDNVQPLAKSLQNIYKEIKTDLGIESPKSGDLTRWADQGVFLLNTSLTVRAGDPNSHAYIGWSQFTDDVIKTISNRKDGVVFLLWGGHAQKKAVLIDKDRHHVLKSPHPSPLSAYRGFFGCKHFSKANELLILQEKEPINW
ncbi:MAG: uracil-DNA glycosylase [Crocinitomicaceae bacterium]